jgi:hypothetical protein
MPGDWPAENVASQGFEGGNVRRKVFTATLIAAMSHAMAADVHSADEQYVCTFFEQTNQRPFTVTLKIHGSKADVTFTFGKAQRDAPASEYDILKNTPQGLVLVRSLTNIGSSYLDGIVIEKSTLDATYGRIRVRDTGRAKSGRCAR